VFFWSKYSGITKEYFYRKQATGKNGKIVLNALANKLLRILCAVILSDQSYDPGYKSVHYPQQNL
jgi:hypothetical protein